MIHGYWGKPLDRATVTWRNWAWFRLRQSGLDQGHAKKAERGSGWREPVNEVLTVRDLPRPRWLRQFRAWLLGWFWLPCPVCGQMFAGFESGDVFVEIDINHDRVACKRHVYGTPEALEGTL